MSESRPPASLALTLTCLPRLLLLLVVVLVVVVQARGMQRWTAAALTIIHRQVRVISQRYRPSFRDDRARENVGGCRRSLWPRAPLAALLLVC